MEKDSEQPAPHQLSEGDLINERFKLMTVIGAGGYGCVWKALDLASTKLCAIKMVAITQFNTL